jgi:hypothetical protein
MTLRRALRITRGSLAAGAALAIGIPVHAQSIPPGALTAPVVSHSNPSQRYAIYVPPGLDTGRPAPVLYLMDYRGRGRVAAELFQPAAERFGWIIVSSYNTLSDGATQPNLIAMQAMWSDSHDLFTIDDRRTYLAGISGTARVATWIARHFEGTFTGVIGAAAAFHPEFPPTGATKHHYFGTVGDIDYNFWEMRLLERRLTDLELPHRMGYFMGRHGWMPADLAMTAIAWMELRAMAAGLSPVDDDLVARLWTEDITRAAALEEEGQTLEASGRFAAIARDYANLRPEADRAPLLVRARSLRDSPKGREQARALQRGADRHENLADTAMEIITEAFPVEAAAPRQPLGATIRKLDITRYVTAASSEDEEQALRARRVLAEIDVQTGFYLPVEALRLGEDDRAAYYLGIARAITEDDPYAWYLSAKIHARQRRMDAAIAALERAVEHGFETLDAVVNDPAFTPLAGTPAFGALVAQLRAQVDGGR